MKELGLLSKTQDVKESTVEVDSITDVLKDFMISKINCISLCLTSLLYINVCVFWKLPPQTTDFVVSFTIVFFQTSILLKTLAVICSFNECPIPILETKNNGKTKMYKKIVQGISKYIGINLLLLCSSLCAFPVFIAGAFCSFWIPITILIKPCFVVFFWLLSFCFGCRLKKKLHGPIVDFVRDEPHCNILIDVDPNLIV